MISGFRREEDGNSAVLSHHEDRTGRRSTSGTDALTQHIGGIEFQETENSLGMSQALQGSGNGFSLMLSNAISRFVPRPSFKSPTHDETDVSCKGKVIPFQAWCGPEGG